jgi:uncharacterized membrane protein
MLCNVLLILATTINPLKILRRGAWITILNLAIADFIACADFFLQMYLNRTDKQTLRLISTQLHFFWIFSACASFMLLTLLNVEIYMIIKYPMKSRLILTSKKVLMSCKAVWIVAIGLGFCEISYIWTSKWYAHFQVGYIAVMEVSVAIQVVLKILIVVEITKNQQIISTAQNAKQREVAKTVMILNGIIIVTALPYFMGKQIEIVTRWKINSDHNFPRSLVQFSYYYEMIALLNFVLNPVVYSLRLQDYRRSLLALFKFNCRSRRHIEYVSRQRPNPRHSSSLENTEMTKVNALSYNNIHT